VCVCVCVYVCVPRQLPIMAAVVKGGYRMRGVYVRVCVCVCVCVCVPRLQPIILQLPPQQLSKTVIECQVDNLKRLLASQLHLYIYIYIYIEIYIMCT